MYYPYKDCFDHFSRKITIGIAQTLTVLWPKLSVSISRLKGEAWNRFDFEHSAKMTHYCFLKRDS